MPRPLTLNEFEISFRPFAAPAPVWLRAAARALFSFADRPSVLAAVRPRAFLPAEWAWRCHRRLRSDHPVTKHRPPQCVSLRPTGTLPNESDLRRGRASRWLKPT